MWIDAKNVLCSLCGELYGIGVVGTIGDVALCPDCFDGLREEYEDKE